jgi:hypothetical protein
MGRRLPGTIVTPRAPDADAGPRRFIRSWLTFDENRPVRTRTMWKLIATVAIFLVACALLASLGGPLQR